MLNALRVRLASLFADPRAPRAIIVAGFVLRFVALVLLRNDPLSGDGLSYHQTAIDLARGVNYEPHWPPGLPYFLSLAYRINDSQFTGRAMMLIVYGVFCWLILMLGRRLGGPRAANIALAVFALTPIFVWSSVTPLTQLYSATMALGSVTFADRCLERKPTFLRDCALLGIALAWLLMTRPSNAGIALAVPAYVFWRTRRWQVVAIPAVLIAITVGAWSAKAYAMTGHKVFINDANAQNIYYGNNPWTPNYRTWWFGSRHREDGDELPEGYEADLKEISSHPMAERDHVYVAKALDHIEKRPDLFIIRTAARVRTFGAFETYTSAQVARSSKILGALTLALDAALYLLVVGFAIFFPCVRASPDPDVPDNKETMRLILIVAILYALPYFAVFSHPTFHFTDVPLIGLLGAAVLARLLVVGAKPLWIALGKRTKVAVALGFAFFVFIQLEWVQDLLVRPMR
jgi:hypothetical protein